jgi:hypothetical protein
MAADGTEGAGGDTAADGAGEAAASSDPAVVASATATKPPAKAQPVNRQRAKQQRKNACRQK